MSYIGVLMVPLRCQKKTIPILTVRARSSGSPFAAELGSIPATRLSQPQPSTPRHKVTPRGCPKKGGAKGDDCKTSSAGKGSVISMVKLEKR